MHIGMIGGVGPESTGFYYKNFIKQYSLASELFDLTIVHADVVELRRNILANAPHKQAEVFLKLALRLEAAGADIIIISSVAGHFCISEFQKISPLPIVSIISALNEELSKSKLKRIGLLGTQISMETRLFGGLSSAEVVVPLGEDINFVHDVYIKMSTTGTIDAIDREFLFLKGKELCEIQGAEAVILAGTDLFLAFEGHECGFNVIDSALVHINYLRNM